MLLPAPIVRMIILISLLLLSSDFLFSQEEPEYDEIAVFMEVKGIGSMEIPAVIRGEELYLPITDLFDFLHVRNVPTSGLDSISGFFINPDAKFYISRTNNSIVYQEKLIKLEDGDLIRTDMNLYLRASYFGKIFGLNSVFSFRSLSVLITSELELPLIKEMKQQELRKNLTRLKGEIIADKNIGRTYPGFRFGMADWSAIATEELNGASAARLNLSLGAVVAGGETNLSLYYNTGERFSEKQQNYLWRFVNNDFAPLRQVMAGKINTQSVASIYNPVIGVQLTNTPSTFRRSFGTYTLSDKTEPGWIVELYVNNVLVDYVTADASGFYKFEVPLVYGYTIVKLKFYGPWGEERQQEQNISIPFNFVPEKTLEYTVSGGVVEDTLWSRFSKASVNYGLTRAITVGGGIEYLSSVTTGPVMPFAKASFRIANRILLSGEYSYGVRAKGTLSYRMPSNIQFDIDYTWYHPGQKAIRFNYLQERRITAAAPLVLGNFASFNRLSVNQVILPGSQYTTGEWLFSGSFSKVNTNLTTYGIFIGDLKPFFYSNLSLSGRLPWRIVIMPQAQFSYKETRFLSAKLKIEKILLDNAFISLSYERNFFHNSNLAEVGLRYDFNAARAGFSVRHSAKKTTFIEQASGSLITDAKNGFAVAENRPNVGKGGATIIPFFDLNSNGVRDNCEQRVPGLNVRVNGGRVMVNEKDTSLHVTGLEPYTSYMMELDPGSFENIAWQLPYRTLSVVIDANILKTIEVPVAVAGEASGIVTLETNGIRKGQGRIIVNLFNDKQVATGSTLTEDDGYFSFFGLRPGSYYVKPDSAQIRKLEMESQPDSILFMVKSGLDGDVIEGLDFNLIKFISLGEQEPEAIPVPEPVIRKDTTYMVIHEVVEELVTISEDCWAIQLGAFRKKENADAIRKKLEKILQQKLEIVVADNFYKVRASDIKSRAEVDKKVNLLARNGITELWIITLKAKQQQRVLIEKSDSVAVIRDIVDSVGGQPVASPMMFVQAGAFLSNSYAQALKKKLSEMVNNPVDIIYEDNYYKVRINGFTTKADIERILPYLGLMGLRDLWVPPVKTTEPVVPAMPVSADTIQMLPVDTIKKDEAVQPVARPVEKPVVKPVLTVPPVSMSVGEFLKKSEALRAQRRILKKLGLESELTEKWGYYYIIIGGFYTREETYKYYPELAGLGITRISILIKE